MADQHSHERGHGGHDTTGVHGMLLFGGEVLYLSHLPMFARPHNFQVILEVVFDEPAASTLRDDRDTAGRGIYTFAPEPFPMVELDPDSQQQARTMIEGTLFRGHFERGGEAIAEGAVGQVRRVVYYRELDVDAQPGNDELTYLGFGFTGRLHLVHRIGARPSFDHVLTARVAAGTVRDQAGRRHGDDLAREHFETAERFDGAQPVMLRGRTDTFDERLAPDATFDGHFFQTIGPGGSHGFLAQVETGQELYLEHDELT